MDPWLRGLGSTKRVLARELLHRFDEIRCPGCLEALPPDRLTKHHIVPRCRGGPTTLENLVLICRPCHDAIHRAPESVAAERLGSFLAWRSDGKFPPPTDPMPAEEGIRLFLIGISARTARILKRQRFILNPPFDPHWPVGRYLPAGQDGGILSVGPAAAVA